MNKINLGSCFLGNGLTMYDRNREKNADYLKVAHVQGKQNQNITNGDNINITLYDRSANELVIKEIQRVYPNSNIQTINHKY